MDQFGLKMNFLCILQVSRFVFVLKTNLYNYFSIFNHLWTGPQIPESAGALAQMQPRHRKPTRWTAGSISKRPRGSYVRMPDRRGINDS
jgi:hypothetical protein